MLCPWQTGKYKVRGVTYLEGAHHQEKLVSGIACQVFIEEEDDWCDATIARIAEISIPNTEVKFRKYCVAYKKQGGDDDKKHISRQQLVDFYEKHDPAKKANIDTMLEHFSGEQIEQNLRAKYSDAPAALEAVDLQRQKEGGAPEAAETMEVEVGADAIRLIEDVKEKGGGDHLLQDPAPLTNEDTGLGE
jgi:hypothetical protein